jgi:hypothetical protein
LIAGLIAYSHQEKKPGLHLDEHALLAASSTRFKQNSRCLFFQWWLFLMRQIAALFTACKMV